MEAPEYIDKRPESKFRNATGLLLTSALFFEFSPDRDKVVYTLKDIDWKGYPSIYRLYMELSDLTEYEFGNKYFESYSHWKKVSDATWMHPIVSRWRTELDLKTKAEALKVIKEEANNKLSKNRFAANKMLIDRAWELRNPGPPNLSKNRLSKFPDKVAEQILANQEEHSRIEEDFSRIMGLEG